MHRPALSPPPVSPLALALLVAFATPGLAAAQAVPTAPDAPTVTELDQVVVTGSRGRERSALETPVPVDILDGDDVRRAAALNGELGSALQALLPSLNLPRQSNSGGADHVRAAQIRGTSPDQVLVLVNGRRRHTSALVNTGSKTGRGTTPVDLNAIPVSAIRRVEVLRDGAGALYGSDAIAGVINIILEDGPEGGVLEASTGLHHTRVDAIDQTLTDGHTAFAAASAGTTLGPDGFLRGGVELKRRGATNRAGYDQLPFFEAQTPANLALRGRRNYVLGDGESEELLGWFNAARPVGAGLEAYAFGTLRQADTEGANFFRYPDSSATIPAIHPGGYRPVSEVDNRDLALAAGLRGRAGGWDLDATLSLGRNDVDYRLRDSLNASLGAASPTRFLVGTYAGGQASANLDGLRDVAIGDATLTLALGGELRREHFSTGAGDPASYAAGPLTDRPTGAQAGGGIDPADTADLARDVAGAYASLSGELGERLTVDAATRFEHYEDFGGQWTGKLAGRWAFTEAVALRASASNNVRAPSLSQVGFEQRSTGYGSDGRLVQSRLLSVEQPIARALGATDLQPETATNLGLGLTVRAGEGFDLSIDAFRIEVDDRITLSERITGQALTDFIEQAFGVEGIEAVNFFTNAVDTRTEGLEVVANQRLAAFGGELALTAAWSLAETEVVAVKPTPAALLALGADNVLFGVEEANTLTDAAPRTRGVLSGTWTGARWTLLGRATRHGSTTRVFNFGGGFEPRQTYGAEWQFDAEAAFRATEALTLAVGGQNITDAYPDASIADIGYFGNLPYDVLSPIGSNGAYWYARLRYAF